MKTIRRICLVGLCLSATAFVVSCDSSDSYHVYGRGPAIGHGPPAHAPAHGYRRHHVGGYEVVYDSSSGVYVVVGIPGCYYHEGYFYRVHDDIWGISVRADGGWSVIGHDGLPPGLRTKAKVRVASGGGPKLKVGPSPQGKAKGHAKLK
ncbi:MAG: hypothetical protein JW993_15475 [Sedimentisphaerales bacterium]|nr:hypothetical protein [Sedimentisphaerales bacterium]